MDLVMVVGIIDLIITTTGLGIIHIIHITDMVVFTSHFIIAIITIHIGVMDTAMEVIIHLITDTVIIALITIMADIIVIITTEEDMPLIRID